MKQVTPLSATPLFALECVSLDLESTGLDASKERIVQIGTVPVASRKLVNEEAWEQIVDPKIAIPARSSAIHGLTGADMRSAPELSEVWPEFLAHLNGRVLIGHTIAFDMTLIEAEAQRHGLEWQRPRALCMRMLAPIALPDLHDPSLDKLAAWFGIENDNRHTALADAVMTAEVFLRLAPLLEEKGIRTLAEAERASKAKPAIVRESLEAGWVDPVADPAEHTLAGKDGKFDTYAYRHCVREIMAQDVVVIGESATLADAIAEMASRSIGSVLVGTPPEAGHHISNYGILTERGVLRQIKTHGKDALDIQAGTVASRPVQAIRGGAYVYRAISRMRRLQVRNLAVLDDQRWLTGVVSARDLLRLRTEAAIALEDGISAANNAGEMARAWAGLPDVVRSLMTEEIDPHTLTAIVSEEIRAMTERAAFLAERAMFDEGHGDPPCPYCVLVLGSAGRGESLLKPDQDNALLFAEGDPGGENDLWFEAMGHRMNDILHQAGIPLCDGGIMAKNAQWRGSVETWTNRISKWTTATTPEAVLCVDIVFDQTAVHGERNLGTTFFTESWKAAEGNVGFAKALAAELEHTSSQITFLGGIKHEGNRIDLKLHGLFPITAAARALTIRHGFPNHSTHDRLEALLAVERGDTALISRLSEHHAFILSLMLDAQEQAISSGHKPTNQVDLTRLDRARTSRLKTALSDIALIPDLVRDVMF